LAAIPAAVTIGPSEFPAAIEYRAPPVTEFRTMMFPVPVTLIPVLVPTTVFPSIRLSVPDARMPVVPPDTLLFRNAAELITEKPPAPFTLAVHSSTAAPDEKLYPTPVLKLESHAWNVPREPENPAPPFSDDVHALTTAYPPLRPKPSVAFWRAKHALNEPPNVLENPTVPFKVATQ